MSNSTMIKTVFFAATPETIWEYLTKADKLGEWFNPTDNDLAPDSDYGLVSKGEDGGIIVWGKVIGWQPSTQLQYTFEIHPFNGATTTVTWDLEEAHGGTKLTLTHEGIGELGDAALGLLMALDGGWDEHIACFRKALKGESVETPDCSDE